MTLVARPLNWNQSIQEATDMGVMKKTMAPMLAPTLARAFVCMLLTVAILPGFSEDAKGDALLEQSLWDQVDLSCLDADEEPTDLISDGTWLYLATSDGASPYEAGIYRINSDGDCSPWQSTDSYYIYSSHIHDTEAIYWGTRYEPSPSLAGDIWTFDGATFSKIARSTWYDPATTHAGWLQSNCDGFVHYAVCEWRLR
jgi:hypothetical protein